MASQASPDHGSRTDPTGSSCDEERISRLEAVPFECNQGLHRGESCGADGHRLVVRDRSRELDEPVGLHPGTCGITTPPRLTDAPSCEDNSIARREPFVVTVLDDARKIDTGNMGIVADETAHPLEDHAVLVVERGIVDCHRDIAFWKSIVFYLGNRGFKAAFGLVENKCSEGHGSGT